ncbi:MAG: hypothetical protein KatS3mg087_0180 [Patescibacteria group bacterium]|nr:MAG: hypothetical protein KatS3mg087_0180 [Patescibacteria group bacterium]
MRKGEQCPPTAAEILAKHGTIDGVPITKWIQQVNSGHRPPGEGAIDIPAAAAEYIRASRRDRASGIRALAQINFDKSCK